MSTSNPTHSDMPAISVKEDDIDSGWEDDPPVSASVFVRDSERPQSQAAGAAEPAMATPADMPAASSQPDLDPALPPSTETLDRAVEPPAPPAPDEFAEIDAVIRSFSPPPGSVAPGPVDPSPVEAPPRSPASHAPAAAVSPAPATIDKADDALVEPKPPAAVSVPVAVELARTARPAPSPQAEALPSAVGDRKKPLLWAGAAAVLLLGVAAILVFRPSAQEELAPAPVASVTPAPSHVKDPQAMAKSMARAAAEAAPSAAAPSPPPAASSGPRSVELDILPAQTLVFYKGQKLGKSPLKIDLAPGEKKDLFLARDGYRPLRITVDGTEPKVSVTMTPYEGAAEQSDQTSGKPATGAAQAPKKPTRWEPEAFTN
jgi:hypothetical protein